PALLGEGKGTEALVAGHPLRQELAALGQHVEELDDFLAGHFPLEDALLDHRHDLQERLVQLTQPVVQIVLCHFSTGPPEASGCPPPTRPEALRPRSSCTPFPAGPPRRSSEAPRYRRTPSPP